MEETGTIDLFAPTMSDTILEVRCGKMKDLQGLSVQSGIDKSICDRPVEVNSMGIEGDEHDLTVRFNTLLGSQQSP
jgi:hypothetical protein